MRAVLTIVAFVLVLFGVFSLKELHNRSMCPRHIECLNNLSQIGKYLLTLDAKGKMKDFDGEEFLFQISGFLRPNQMQVFKCDEDPDCETTRCSYRGASAESLAAQRTNRKRRFFWACCEHHDDGVCVLDDDGSTKFIPWSEVEGYDGDPVEVGPNSPDPRFRHLVR